ncbi:hypothetical protein RvY_09850 [Ramazzottius varieornatus]|uniref:Uncharacterized protein n=1 Tax=Ramazzottius varieornatus TaxID=947166 RepID=A0A1D1VF76_RAMVA|nr:hypothetical protein RvY_09850 [Ramazzottius varieornatus]
MQIDKHIRRTFNELTANTYDADFFASCFRLPNYQCSCEYSLDLDSRKYGGQYTFLWKDHEDHFKCVHVNSARLDIINGGAFEQ